MIVETELRDDLFVNIIMYVRRTEHLLAIKVDNLAISLSATDTNYSRLKSSSEPNISYYC